jgi:hypothetical protein
MKTIRLFTIKHGKLMLRTLTILFLIGVAYSCEKKSDFVQPKFDIKYRMYTDGDPSLNAAVIYCTTVFPEENLTSWINTGKWRNANWYQPELVLHNYDSLIVIPDIQGYPSCYYQFWVCLHFYDSLGNPYKRTYFKSDSIKNKTNADIRFYWPTDSSNYSRIE